MSSAPFMHHPAQPHIPAEAEYADQRLYSRQRGANLPMGKGHAETPDISTTVDVFRYATTDRARLRIGLYGTNITAETWLTPTELRTLARELIDAAHDIESTAPRKSPHEGCWP